jgi:hypothetical protein
MTKSPPIKELLITATQDLFHKARQEDKRKKQILIQKQQHEQQIVEEQRKKQKLIHDQKIAHGNQPPQTALDLLQHPMK